MSNDAPDDKDPAEVLILPGFGRRDVTAMLQATQRADLAEVLVLGWTADGDLFISTSMERSDELVWIMEKAKGFILGGGSTEA